MLQTPVICHLVLTISEGLSFVFDESSEFLLELFDSVLKVSAHLLYEYVTLANLSLPCWEHNLKFLFLELRFVGQIYILCYTPTIKLCYECLFELF